MRQLILPFGEEPGYAAEDFLWGAAHAPARALLAAPAAWSNLRLVLWGAPGVGKTHLLHHWAAGAGAALVPAPALRATPDTPPRRPLAIDDADTAGSETALFHLLNAAREAGLPALLAMRAPPARAAIGLADLASRLRASSAVELPDPDEPMLALLLERLAADRQLLLSEPVKRYLLTRLPREPAALREAMARLDRAALAAGRAPGRALAARVLAAMGADGPGGAPADEAESLSTCHSPASAGFL